MLCFECVCGTIICAALCWLTVAFNRTLISLSPICRKQLSLPSLRMYEDQCKVDRDGGDSDASSCEQATGRDSVHSPLGDVTSPLKFNRSSRGRTVVSLVWFHGFGLLRHCLVTKFLRDKKAPSRIVYT